MGHGKGVQNDVDLRKVARAITVGGITEEP
jgi:hypothetical protein